MAAHTCHAIGCNVATQPELLMCRRHWRLVPVKLQKAVWKHYRPGQCDDKRPSKEWHQAADAAIGFVGLYEGRSVLVCHANALTAYGYMLRCDDNGILRAYVRTWGA